MGSAADVSDSWVIGSCRRADNFSSITMTEEEKVIKT